MRTLRIFALTIFVALLSAAAAQECTWEVEPNDTPAAATLITGLGPESAFSMDRGRAPTACLAGELSGGDQDAFIWEVDEHGADQLWVIDLEGITNQLTRLDVMRLTFADNQIDVTAREDLLSVGTTTGRRVTSSEFVLEPGQYYIGLSTSGGSGQYVAYLRSVESLSYWSQKLSEQPKRGEFSAVGTERDGSEQEWIITDEDAQFAWNIRLEAALGSAPELVLTGPSGVVGRAKADATGHAQLGNLGLVPGQYRISVGGSGNFRLGASRAGRKGDGVAFEPNDNFEQATIFDLGTIMRGSISGSDYFRVTVDEAAAAAAWTLELESQGELTLALKLEDGQDILRRRSITSGVEGLSLSPGVYQLLLTGARGTNYTMSWQQATLPAGGWEVEPNDRVISATPIGEDGQVRGHLNKDDADTFSFEVTGEAQLYRLQLISKGSAEMAVLDGGGRDYAVTRGNQRLRLDNVHLLPGTHHIRVSGQEGEYALRLLPLGPAPQPPRAEDLPDPEQPLRPAPAATQEQPAEEAAAAPEKAALPPLPPPPPGHLELEPNNDRTRAELIVPGVPRVGTLPDERDADFYRFFLADDQPVRIELVPPAGGTPIGFRLDERGWVYPARDAKPGDATTLDLWLLAGDHYVEVRGTETGDGYYQLRLSQLNAALPREPQDEEVESPLTVTLTGLDVPLAAYWQQGQSLTTTARITNQGPDTEQITLNAASSDARVNLQWQQSLQLAPGASAELPVHVSVPADLRDDLPLRISLAATTGVSSTGASVAFGAVCEAQPINPAPYWPVPQPLLGGIDVLWSGLGARIHGESTRQHRDEKLIDGIVTPSNGGYVTEAEPSTYVLAGTEAVEVVGALLHPLSGAKIADQLRKFRIESSVDGVTFTTAFEGELKSARIEQAFVFDQPVLARYARLVGIDNQTGGQTGWLGEFKLIAADKQPLGGFNLAEPAIGGHVVWSDPHTGNKFLEQDARPSSMDLRGMNAFTFVIGFHNGRAAQITGLEWADVNVSGAKAFPSVKVEVSLEGAAGPWQPLAEWQLTRDGTGRAHLQLEEASWARYLRFTAAAAEPEQRYWSIPADLVVHERPSDAEYFSILGEWGTASPLAIYEYLEPPLASAVTEDEGGNDSLETARPLANGQAVTGTVMVAEDVDWYRLSIEAGHNHLEVRLSGEPSIAYDYHLMDASGEPVPYDARKEGDNVILSLYGDPGDYYLKLEEPKRTVVFSWDTSGSMGPFLEITYNALASFAAGVDGDREYVQLLAYDEPRPQWLLPIWTGDSARVQRTVNEYDRRADSSNSETALLAAVRALGQREGTRALMLITDAETTGYSRTTQVWRALEEVLPRIFTFEVSSGGSLFSQQLMQDWAAVNDGHYSLAATIGDLDAGYNRASCILRRPKQYQVEVISSAAPLPGPGSLSVARPQDAAQPAVEIIFDASGSMGVPLPSGEQRITAAKRVLEDLVTAVIPEGAPFALRAFGHVQPMSCDTRLEIPLGPLERDKALAAIRSIEPKLLSGTPLAASLALVSEDLAKAGRGRTVILITDGEESCDGNPIEAVRELRRLHPLDVAIVSLGLEQAERQSFEELAAATNASYVDVTSFEELRASVNGALHPRFEVINAQGEVVASGLVDGDPVDVEMGVYTVRVYGAVPREFHDVRVPGEKSVALTYGGQ